MRAAPTATVQPPWTRYTLETAPYAAGAPGERAVVITERGLDGRRLRQHIITAAQARDLAAGLIAAADYTGPDDTTTTEGGGS